MAKKTLSKRQKQFAKALETLNQPASAKEGFDALKKVLDGVSKSKLNETIETHIRLGVDVKQADQQVRSTVVLPEGTGKTVRVAVIAKGDKVKEAAAAGADFAGSDELIEKIDKENWFDFDVLVATPDMMAAMAKLGRSLGPKGLMPNPKTGTVTSDVAKAVKELKAGKVEFRTDKTAIIHTPIGKKNFTPEQMLKNFAALYDAVLRAKPSAAKGVYVKSLYITSTMGPSIKLDPQRVATEIKDYIS